MKFRCENCGEAFYHNIVTYDQIMTTTCPWCKSFVVVKIGSGLGCLKK